MKNTDGTWTILTLKDDILQFVEAPRPKGPPDGCGQCNEDLECLGCGEKLGCIKPEHCYAIEGRAALKGH